MTNVSWGEEGGATMQLSIIQDWHVDWLTAGFIGGGKMRRILINNLLDFRAPTQNVLIWQIYTHPFISCIENDQILC